jgi:hypothetical protein
VEREIEQVRETTGSPVGMARVWQYGVRVSKFVKERLHHSIYSRKALRRSVLQQFRDQVDRSGIRFSEDLDRN